MIEHQDALANLDEILTTPGLDGIVVGPADLAVSMGHLLEPGHADVEKAIEQILEGASGTGARSGSTQPRRHRRASG